MQVVFLLALETRVVLFLQADMQNSCKTDGSNFKAH